MGSCKNKRLIGPFLDGQLGDCKWLEEHLSECSECLAEYEMIQRLSHIAGKTDYPPPEGNYWKQFNTRVMARIAARPQVKSYPRFIEMFFANRLAVKLAVPLMAVLIAVLALKTYMPLDRLDSSTINPIVAETVVADEKQAGQGIVTTLDQPVLLSDTNAAPVMKTQSKFYSSTETESALSTKPVPGIILTEANTDDLPFGFSEQSIVVDSSPTITDLVNNYLDGRDLKTSFARLTSGSGLKTDLAHSLSLKSKVFDTDQVIKFQIMAGSNPSLAPLEYYREAANKFYAPEISDSRKVAEQSETARWGYGSGDDKYNEEQQRHLNLEFDLARDK